MREILVIALLAALMAAVALVIVQPWQHGQQQPAPTERVEPSPPVSSGQQAEEGGAIAESESSASPANQPSAPVPSQPEEAVSTSGNETTSNGAAAQPAETQTPTTTADNATAPSTITLASFNLLHLGYNNGKNLDDLALILSRYDIIALQEVMKKSGDAPDPLADLKTVRDKVQALNVSQGSPAWEFRVTPGPIGRSSYKEYYAILYRTDRVQYAGGERIVSDPQDVFIREPFLASFRAGNFDFTLMTMHAIGPGEATLDDEIAALDNAFLAVQEQSSCEDDLILTGDFNTPADDSDWSQFRTIPSIQNLIPATTKTSIGEGRMANAYDNIWVQSAFTGQGREYAGLSGAYYYFEDLYSSTPDMYATAKDILSDHVPVWAVFRTDLPDDDGPCP